MFKYVISCDEKWPVFDLLIPEEGQEGNCEIPEGFYREFLSVSLQYAKFQKELKEYYDEYQRECSEQTCGTRFPEGFIPQQHTFNTISKPA